MEESSLQATELLVSHIPATREVVCVSFETSGDQRQMRSEQVESICRLQLLAILLKPIDRLCRTALITELDSG